MPLHTYPRIASELLDESFQLLTAGGRKQCLALGYTDPHTAPLRQGRDKTAPVIRGRFVKLVITSRSVRLLLEPGGFADLISKEIQLRAANLAPADNFDLHDLWRVDGKRALDTHTEGNLSNGERLAVTRTVTPDHDALEDLDALTGAFHYAVVHFDIVTDLKLGQVVSNLLLLDRSDDVHRNSLTVRLSLSTRRAPGASVYYSGA